MQGIFLRNLCMKQKAGRLRSILCRASFAVEDQEWPPRVLWPCAAENIFDFVRIRLCGARCARSCFMIPQKRTAAQCAAVLFDAFSAKTTDYSAAIAPVGQAPSQAPQSMQESAFTTAAPFSMVIAPTGQAPSQAPQPTHASETLCAIIKSPFIPVPVVMYEEMCQARLYTSLRNSYPCLHFNKAEKKRQD